MFIEEIKNIPRGKREIRKFGLTIGVVLLLLGILLFFRGKSSYPYLLALALFFLLSGIALPTLLKPVYIPWMAAAVIMGFVMTRVILVILFYLVFTPIALFMKVGKRDLLNQRIDRNVKSYWQGKEKKPFDKKQYEKQY